MEKNMTRRKDFQAGHFVSQTDTKESHFCKHRISKWGIWSNFEDKKKKTEQIYGHFGSNPYL